MRKFFALLSACAVCGYTFAQSGPEEPSSTEVGAPAQPAEPEESVCCNPPREPRPCCSPVNPCPMKAGMDDEVYLISDFLWWRSENHGYSYAFNRTNDIVPQGKVMRVNPNWDPGFRLGLGWNTSYDHWDLLAVWTWYHNHATTTQDELAATDNLGYYPQWPVATDDSLGPYKHVSAGYTLHYDTGDWEMGRGYYATKSIALRPHIGLRGMWMSQSFRNHFSLPIPADSMDRKFSGCNNAWGVGPRLGLNGEWHVDGGISFLGKVSSALVYGETHVRHTTYSLPSGQTGYTLTADYSEHFWQLSPSLQLQLGLQWEHYFPSRDKFFKCGVSWEANYWWNQFQIPVVFGDVQVPMPTTGNQPVTIEGITLDIELDF